MVKARVFPRDVQLPSQPHKLHKLKGFIVLCVKTGKEIKTRLTKVKFFYYASNCKDCGSTHGKISIEFLCPYCNKVHIMDMADW